MHAVFGAVVADSLSQHMALEISRNQQEVLNQRNTMDLFGYLSDDLLIHIISFLPTKIAVLTSTLSRRWRSLWCFALESGNSLEFEEGHSGASSLSFYSFVDRVLRLHKLPLEKFTLQINCRFIHDDQLFCQKWIDQAVRHREVKEMNVCFGRDLNSCSRGKYVVSIGVFNSEVLNTLKLECRDMSILRDVYKNEPFSLPNLRVLHLWLSDMDRWSVESFFKAAPQLKEAFLGIEDARPRRAYDDGVEPAKYYDHRVRLVAPCLKRLRMIMQTSSNIVMSIDAPLVEEFLLEEDSGTVIYEVKGMRSLITAKINAGRHMYPASSIAHNVLHPYINVKSLYLGGWTMDDLQCAQRRGDLPTLGKFINLSHLQIRVINYDSWEFLFTLLANAPTLEVLHLKKDFRDLNAEFKFGYILCPPKKVPPCLSKTLREIEFRDCEAQDVELELISYLIENGKVLSSVKVDLLPHCLEKQSKFTERIAMIPMCSKTCQIKVSQFPAYPTRRNLPLGRTLVGDQRSPTRSNLSPGKVLGQFSTPQCLLRFRYNELVRFTDRFDSKNLITRTQLSRIYHGKIPRLLGGCSRLMVKIWASATQNSADGGKEFNAYCLRCLQEELKLLGQSRFSSHPNFLRVYGYCEEKGAGVGIVYSFEPSGSLYELIPKENFIWLQRIKVALGLACIFEYLHKGPSPTYLRNFDIVNVILDQDYNPFLADFSRISGGIFPDRTRDHRDSEEWRRACSRCDPWFSEYENALGSIRYGNDGRCSDTFAYGVVLLSLISKRVHKRGEDESSDDSVCGWAEKKYQPRKIDLFFYQHKASLVDASFKADPTFNAADGLKLTNLAMPCVGSSMEQPTMKGVVKCLLRLNVVKQHWHALDCDKILSFLDVDD